MGSTATTTQVSDVSGTDAYATNGYAGGMNVKWTITFSAGSGAMPQYSNVTSNTADTGAANSGVFTFASLTTLPSIGSMFTLTESSMVQTAVWDNANITIRNFNTQISNLRDVEFGGFWITNWTAPPQTATYNATGITMLLPPEGPTQVDFSVANFNVTKATSFQITLEAADANDFSAYYPIAAPFVSSNIVAQNLGEVTEDVLDLSATPSTNQTISEYIWQVNFPETGWTQGDWADTAHLITVFASGQSLDMSPNLLIGNPLLPSASANGPFQVTVMSVNPYGQVASSTSLIIPENPDMAPASEINAMQESSVSCGTGGPTTVTVTVYNILNQPVSGVTVYFVPLGHASGVTLSSTFATTAGNPPVATTMVSCMTPPFTLEISSPGINPIQLSIF